MSVIFDIGLEIEYYGLKHTELDPFLPRGWRRVEDGSCRNFGVELGKRVFATDALKLPLRRVMLGGELVSPILSSENPSWHQGVRQILEELYIRDEPLSPKTSIHVHVNIESAPYYVVRNIFRLCLHLEDVMYRIGCGESGIHRGSLMHDYGYCRPISQYGPPAAMDSSGYYRQAFTPETVLSAQDTRELRIALGRSDVNTSKYLEARYVWMNLVSYFIRGSCEFRVFNLTKRISILLAWIEICQAIVRTAFSELPELEVLPLGTAHSGGTQLTPDDLSSLLNLNTETIGRVWELGVWCPPVHGYQQGHLGREIHWGDISRHLIPPRLENSTVYSFNQFNRNDVTTMIGGGQ